MSRRLKITLPEIIATQLDELAANIGEPAARLAGQMVRHGIIETANGQVHPPSATPAPVVLDAPEEEEPDRRAPWLEPYGGDYEWRSWMWGGIVALHGRYPTPLTGLKDGWWKNATHVETLCALVVWRQWIDDAGRDPPRRARLPGTALRLQPHSPPGRRQRHPRVDTRPCTRRVDPLTPNATRTKSCTQGTVRVGGRGRARTTGSADDEGRGGLVAAATCTGGVGFASWSALTRGLVREATVPSSPSATIAALFGSSVLILAQAVVNVHVDGDKWWITAVVAIGAALLGSFGGAIGLYYASVALEGRRRKALSEIRRKAKVYTPIREELMALRRAIAEDFHLSIGVRRERSDDQWPRDAPLLVIWREFVDDGRAHTTASESVREALERVEGATDVFNLALKAARHAFNERGDAITEQSGFTPDVPYWQRNEFETLLRHGVRAARMYREYPSPSDPHKDVSPLRSAPATLTAEQTAFVTLWEGDEVVRDTATKLGEAERGLDKAAELAITELDAAMKRIADDYEHEPD